MLKIVHPIYCGMDIHKSFVVACIATTNDHGVTTYKRKILHIYRRFATVRGLAQWEQLQRCVHRIHRKVLDTRV